MTRSIYYESIVDCDAGQITQILETHRETHPDQEARELETLVSNHRLRTLHQLPSMSEFLPV